MGADQVPGETRTAPPRGRLARLPERLFATDSVAIWLERLKAHRVPYPRED